MALDDLQSKIRAYPTSDHLFVVNQIADADLYLYFVESHSNKKFYYKHLPGQSKGELLPQRYRDQFRRKQIICVEYSEVTEEDEREIFKVCHF